MHIELRHGVTDDDEWKKRRGSRFTLAAKYWEIRIILVCIELIIKCIY